MNMLLHVLVIAGLSHVVCLLVNAKMGMCAISDWAIAPIAMHKTQAWKQA